MLSELSFYLLSSSTTSWFTQRRHQNDHIICYPYNYKKFGWSVVFDYSWTRQPRLPRVIEVLLYFTSNSINYLEVLFQLVLLTIHVHVNRGHKRYGFVVICRHTSNFRSNIVASQVRYSDFTSYGTMVLYSFIGFEFLISVPINRWRRVS